MSNEVGQCRLSGMVDGSFTLFYDGQFWVGLATREQHGRTEVARVVFGPEPSDAEFLEWAKHHYADLPFSPTTAALLSTRPVGNPKRRQREAAKALEETRTRTAAQAAWHDALKLQVAERASQRRQRHQAEADRRYAQRVEKRKQRARGK